MGGGSWTRESFVSYSKKTNKKVKSDGTLDFAGVSAQQVYQMQNLAPELNPKDVIRECCDSAEHPNTIPVILALDVTGSMGDAALKVAGELNTIMTNLYESVKDVEFMIMGIGDFDYDDAPLQVSQFESDIRIAAQLDKVYFEMGGGGNGWESYTAAWAFAIKQTKLDCWKRGKKGVIITMGDEPFNPYIPCEKYQAVTGHGSDFEMGRNIESDKLYEQVKELYDVYHINVNHKPRQVDISGFKNMIGEDHVFDVPVNGVPEVIAQIVKDREANNTSVNTVTSAPARGISW